MSSQTRQYFLLYQVQYQAQIDTLFCSMLCWFSLSSCSLVAALKFSKLEIFWKIDFDHNVGNDKNNF